MGVVTWPRVWVTAGGLLWLLICVPLVAQQQVVDPGFKASIRHIRSFTGQSLGVPAGATILMRLSTTARDAAIPADLDAEDAAAKSTDASTRGLHSNPVAGRAQGLAMTFGNGRVVVLGEAGLLSAQVVRYPNGTEMKFGMNVPGNDDRQFALNILHWLSGFLR